MGSRYAWDFEMPPQRYEAAQDWSDIDSEGETCVMPIPQPGVDTGAPGLPRVNGAGQSGSSIVLDGLTPQYVFRRNWWLSVVTGGQRFCYRGRAEVVANGSGQMTIPLRTMLRVPHADNDVVEIAEPKVEGFVTPAPDAWAMGPDGLVRLAFSIKEVE